MRIVLGGPRHSGKSVFMWELKRMFPIGSYMPMRCAPDGEGDWTQLLYQADSGLAKDLRAKGQFDESFVSWAAEVVRNCTARFGLIDVGGRVSDENRRICKDADAIVIVAADDEKIPEWLDFAAELNLRVLAVIHSTLSSVDEWHKIRENGVFEGLAVNLDRKTFHGSETIKALAEFLLEAIPEEGKEEDEMNTITISQIADMIGKKEEAYTLPNGREVTGLNWKPEELPAVVAALKPFSALGTPWFVDGPGPQWLMGCIIDALHPCAVVLSDSKVEGGRVPIGQRKQPVKSGKGELEFKVQELDDCVIVKYSSEGPISATLLPELYPPITPEAKPVLLNGRTATWAVAEMVSCYLGTAPAIYVGQPTADGYMYVCAVSHRPGPEYQVGSVIWEKDLSISEE